MIKLSRSFIPRKLNPDFVKVKTDEYKQTKDSVWNIDWLKDSLKELSYGKCAYCECNLTKESNYMEVEHFEDKHHNAEKVMDWNNLIPSCKHCNGHKSTHDVIAEPIVNPFVDNPGEHLYFQNYRYKGRDDKGKETIEVLGLNNGERKMVDTRFDIGNALEELILTVKDKHDIYRENGSVKNRNKMLSSLYDMLRQCQPESEYAALCATVLHSSDDYQDLKNDLQNEGIWNLELEQMDALSRNICLFK